MSMENESQETAPAERSLTPVPDKPKEKMSRAEAGRKGGLSTKKRYGDTYFSEIGRMGGKKGGESTKRKYGIEFYQEIGRRGGSR